MEISTELDNGTIVLDDNTSLTNAFKINEEKFKKDKVVLAFPVDLGADLFHSGKSPSAAEYVMVQCEVLSGASHCSTPCTGSCGRGDYFGSKFADKLRVSMWGGQSFLELLYRCALRLKNSVCLLI